MIDYIRQSVQNLVLRVKGSKQQKQIFELYDENGNMSVERLNVLCLENKQQNGLVPRNGDRIKITWLPPNNAYPNENVYIGSVGTVESVGFDYSFILRYDSGAKLIIVPRKGKRYAEYVFRKLK